MHLLVLNTGSSSLKYELYSVPNDGEPETIGDGLVERIGEADSDADDHVTALAKVFARIEQSARFSSQPLMGIGHRVVHGGEAFNRPVLIDDAVVAEIAKATVLAPLHNPAALAGIRAARSLRPNIPQVAVFDTAFHQTMPAAAYRYALPAWCYDTYGIRRYGMHGTSHAYVSRRAAELLGRAVAETNVITLHLGNGASATAISGGRCIETSMGFTPLEGLVMGTRSGDIDPAIPMYLATHAARTPEQIENVLIRDSGLKGLCGDSDMRAVVARAEAGDARALLAADVYCHRIRKYVGAYFALLGRLDAIVFTAGVGENSAAIRSRVCRDLGHMGIEIDERRNGLCPRGAEEDIAVQHSKVRIFVIPTDEEREIARQTLSLLRQEGAGSL